MISLGLFVAQIVTFTLACVGLMEWSIKVFVPGIMWLCWGFFLFILSEWANSPSRRLPGRTGIKTVRSYPPDENGEY